MTVLHEAAECDRARNAARAARLSRLSPAPKPKPIVIVAPVEPEPILAEVECVETVPVPANPLPKQSFLVDHCQKGEAKDECPTPVPSMTYIKVVVARRYKISMIDMESARRTAKIVRPRQIAQHLCATMTHRSLPAIGRVFGGRDHTTILHARDRIARLRAADPVFDAEIEALKQSILDTFLPAADILPHGKTFSEHSGTSS